MNAKIGVSEPIASDCCKWRPCLERHHDCPALTTHARKNQTAFEKKGVRDEHLHIIGDSYG